ncbi:unnamed protein product [Victoria cruziana]
MLGQPFDLCDLGEA